MLGLASAFEDAAMGRMLALVAFAFVVALIVYQEWTWSAADRKRRAEMDAEIGKDRARA